MKRFMLPVLTLLLCIGLLACGSTLQAEANVAASDGTELDAAVSQDPEDSDDSDGAETEPADGESAGHEATLEGESAGYSLAVSEDPVAPDAEYLPFRLCNDTGADANILLIPTLERQLADGQWETVSFVQQVGFCGVADPLPPGETDWSESLNALWGQLEPGRYRLSYTVTDASGREHLASGEFTVAAGGDASSA